MKRLHPFRLLPLILGLLAVAIALLRADDAMPDARRAEIARTVTDEIVAKIAALKPHNPELAKFGEAPWFIRSSDGFRYDYRTEKVTVTKNEQPQERPLPGGCFLYFHFMAVPDAPTVLPAPPELTDYASGSMWGGERAGIGYMFRYSFHQSADRQNPTYSNPQDLVLSQKLMDTLSHELEGTFAQLTSELILSEKGIGLDTPSLLAAAENPESDPQENAANRISFNAFVVLRSRSLNPEQWTQIRNHLRDGKYRITVFSVEKIVALAEKQAPSEMPDVLLDLVRASLHAEESGADTFQRTPFVGQAWASDARAVRAYVLTRLKDNEPRDLPVAALILSSDSQLDNRINALDFIARQKGTEPRRLLLGALDNTFRSVQAHAAELAGQHKLSDAAPGLRRLLLSPGTKVRTAAVAALKSLDVSVPVPEPPSLPDSARAMADALWQRGLNADDLLKCHQLMAINTPLLPSFDDASVEKAIDARTSPKKPGEHDLPWDNRIPDPFLLAGALKFNEVAGANRIYGTICDEYETDDAALEDATNELGWDRFAEGLNEFHLKHDEAALPWLNQVVALSSVARPFSLLSVYIKQSNELIRYFKTEANDVTGPEPDKSDVRAYVAHWIAELKDCDGDKPSPAGEKIRQMGLPAIPFLIDAVTDRRLTRNFDYGRSYLPERDFVYVGNAAMTIIETIARDYGLQVPTTYRGPHASEPGSQDKLRAWYQAIPPGQKLLPPEKRPPPLLYPAGRYYWGDD